MTLCFQLKYKTRLTLWTLFFTVLKSQVKISTNVSVVSSTQEKKKLPLFPNNLTTPLFLENGCLVSFSLKIGP